MMELATTQATSRKRLSWTGISFESVAIHSAKYRADVDGLRAIAVLSVVFFHLGFAQFRGGFVGVDVFYVISGYLITSLLVRDIADNKFSIVSFYERRARRIFPALFAVLFFSVAAASLLFDPEEMIAYGKALLTTTLFVSNIFYWHSAKPLGYFDSTVSNQPLLHTWSLSVEEQFYMLFPLTLFLLFRWLGRRAYIGILLLTLFSFGLNIWSTQHKPVFAFYWFIPRAWELLVGSLLAAKVLPVLRFRLIREFLGVLGLGLIAFSIYSLPLAGTTFPGYIALFPCLGTCLVIYGGESGPCLTRTILGLRPFVFIGVISYSLYLWHWPLLVFTKDLPFGFWHGTTNTIVLVGSTLLAFLSFEYVERPFRGSRSPFSRRQVFAFGAAASVATAAFGLAAYRSSGLPQRFDPATRQIVLRNLERESDFDASCSNWRNVVHGFADINVCSLGNQSQPKIMFWGDSHVEQLYPLIQRVYSQGGMRGRSVLVAVEDGCLPDAHLNNTREGYHCDSFARAALLRAEQKDIDIVFLGFSTWWTNRKGDFCASREGECVGEPLTDVGLARVFLSDLAQEIEALKAQGKSVVVCLPFPIYEEEIPDLEIRNAMFGRYGFYRSPDERTDASFAQEVRRAAVATGADVFDPRVSLCGPQHCVAAIDGISIYKDNNHLARAGVGILESNFKQVLVRQPVR